MFFSVGKPSVVFVFLFFLMSCQEEEQVSYTIFPTGSTDEINAIHFLGDQMAVAVGGKNWIRGILSFSFDQGLHWNTDSVYDKQIFSLTSYHDQELTAAGIDQRCYKILGQQISILKGHLYRFYRDLSYIDQNGLFLCGGEAFTQGYLDLLDLRTHTYQEVFHTNRELNAICRLDSLHWIVTGFGMMFRSEDQGTTWDSLILRDHWLDISRVDEKTAVAIGINGSIIKTSDAGKHWEKLRNGNSIWVRDIPLRCVEFLNDREGIVAGENGFVSITRDGGSEWTRIRGLPEVNYLDATYYHGHFWLCGSGGVILRID